MLIEREIRLLFCVNKWCFVTYKHVMRQSSMVSHETFMRLSYRRFLLAFVAAIVVGYTKGETYVRKRGMSNVVRFL